MEGIQDTARLGVAKTDLGGRAVNDMDGETKT